MENLHDIFPCNSGNQTSAPGDGDILTIHVSNPIPSVHTKNTPLFTKAHGLFWKGNFHMEFGDHKDGLLNPGDGSGASSGSSRACCCAPPLGCCSGATPMWTPWYAWRRRSERRAARKRNGTAGGRPKVEEQLQRLRNMVVEHGFQKVHC